MIDAQLIEYATETERKYLEAVDVHGSHRQAAKALGIHHSTVNKGLKALRTRAATKGYSPKHHLTRPIAPGLKLRGTSQLYKEGQAEPTLEWIKTSVDEDAREQMLQDRISALCEQLPVLDPVECTSPYLKQDLLNLYTFTDYHMGMLAWHKEGGADWDLKIAEKILWDAFKKMVDSAPNASTCVLNIQGDFLHSDGLLPVTPAHQHILDQDGRFSKIVDVAIRVLRRLIAHALDKHEHVHLLIVEGNHDESSSIWLRRAFAAMYENEPRLTVNDSELPYYVHQHGNVMLAFHHGHKMKNEQMPGLFAAQFSKMWGATEKRYCHTGHRHHLDEKEYSGMTVTQHPTLSARDAYAARGGWIAERAALAITYHDKAGQYARTYISPELLT